MLVGAGLMFVLIHGEVSADSKPKPFVCSSSTHLPYEGGSYIYRPITYCKTKKLE